METTHRSIRVTLSVDNTVEYVAVIVCVQALRQLFHFITVPQFARNKSWPTKSM